jgi:major vault protein
MDERNSKRDLVLAPSEYAYMQDVTKGIVKTYTGPTVINPTAQERAVVFDPTTKRFEPCALDEAVQQIAIAPEGYYLILKNPSTRADAHAHPPPGGVNPSPDLNVGRKINITGPCAFALWPGQLVQLVQGHHLRSNQYLLVRVYNEDEARKHWGQAVVKPAGTETVAVPIVAAPADLAVGKLLIIKGTDVSFYIPPTGVGVVPEEGGAWVREALTLERLEYAILVDQNGKKRYERGPQVVFPAPTETFITRDGARKFKAIELTEIQGLHVKVIAPYTENGKSYREGDELFVTGVDTSIYYPREEHAIVKYDGQEKHFAIAVPAGEARYVMNRKTGEIRMARGPAMLLPNPIEEIFVRRVLSDRECATWYPGNADVLAYNHSLRLRDDTRAQYPKSREVVMATRYEGVPSISVWTGYAILVVDKQGRRRVEQGPKNILLEYDERLEVTQLSTGTPKTDDRLVETVFLRVLNNKVSDRCVVETSDHVRVTLSYALQCSFEGDSAKWFDAENYVKLLCEHVRSVLKGVAKKQSIETFYGQSVDIIRNAVKGMVFAQNGMQVKDVEVLDVTIDDEGIADLLGAAQHEAVEANIQVLRAMRSLDLTAKQESITRGEAEARAETTKRLAELEIAATGDRLRVVMAQIQLELDKARAQEAATIAANAVTDADHTADLARKKSAAALDSDIAAAKQQLVLAALRAEVDAAVARFGAAQGGFSEALLALGNHEVLAKVAEAMSVQSFVGGKTLTDVIDKVFAGTPLAGVMDKVKSKVGQGKNGHSLPAG